MSKEKNHWVLPESTDFGIQIQTEFSEIATTLHSLEGKGSKLRVSIAGDQEEFSSFVISVLDQGNNFQIDELIPFAGNNLMTPGAELAMEVQNEEVSLWFNSVVLESSSAEGIKSHTCLFPEKVELQQKRKHYRIGFMMLERPSLCLKIDDLWIQKVKLCDISPSGVGVSISKVPEQMQPGENIYCRMTIQGQEYPFFATITHISEKPRHGGYHIGMKFTEESLSPEFTKRLSKYLMGLQRQRIRNWSNMLVAEN